MAPRYNYAIFIPANSINSNMWWCMLLYMEVHFVYLAANLFAKKKRRLCLTCKYYYRAVMSPDVSTNIILNVLEAFLFVMWYSGLK